MNAKRLGVFFLCIAAVLFAFFLVRKEAFTSEPAPAGYTLFAAQSYGSPMPAVIDTLVDSSVNECTHSCTNNNNCTNIVFDTESNRCLLQKVTSDSTLEPHEMYNTYVKA